MVYVVCLSKEEEKEMRVPAPRAKSNPVDCERSPSPDMTTSLVVDSVQSPNRC